MTFDVEPAGDQPDTAAVLLAREIRRLRKAAGLSQPQLAARIGYTRQYLSLAERPGKGLASAALVCAIDRALDANGSLIALRESAQADLRARRGADFSAAEPPDEYDAEEAGGDMRRRTLLGLFGPIALSAPLIDRLEELRCEFDGLLLTKPSGRDVDDWEQAVDSYASEVGAVPSAQLMGGLVTDFAEVQLRIIEASGVFRVRLIHCAAQLAALTAIALLTLGEPRSSERWWRTATRAADETADPELAALVRGRRAVFSLYSSSHVRALELAEDAVRVGRGAPCVGVISGLAARAQALAELGRHGDSARSLQAVTDLYARLPARSTTDRTSQWNWAEQRLRNVESHVHTHAGRLEKASHAQDAALSLYPASNFQGRTQIELHRAGALIRLGDISAGTRHLIAVLERLEPQQQTDGIVMRSAVSTLGMVSVRDRGHPTIVGAQELLTSITDKR